MSEVYGAVPFSLHEHGGSGYHQFFQYLVQLPELLVGLLSKAFGQNATIASLRCQERDLSQRCQTTIADTLDAIDAVDRVRQVVADRERMRRVMSELASRRAAARFDIEQDRERFPETIDFLEEIQMCLDEVFRVLEVLEGSSVALATESKEAIDKARDVAHRLGYYSSFSRIFTSVLLYMLGGTRQAIYLANRGPGGSSTEEQCREVISRMDKINWNAHQVCSVVKSFRIKIRQQRLSTEMMNTARENVNVQSVTKSVKTMIDILQRVDTTSHRRRLMSLMEQWNNSDILI